MARSVSSVSAVFVTGMERIGTSSFLRILTKALGNGHTHGVVESVEFPDIVNWGQDLRGKIGKKIRRADNGTNCSLEIFKLWLETETKRNPALQTLLIGGAPKRSGDEKLADFFSDSMVVHIMANYELGKSVIASQGLENIFDLVWEEYQDHTIRVLGKFGRKVVNLDRGVPIRERLEDLFDHLKRKGHESPIPRHLVVDAAMRLGRPIDPIHARIGEVENAVA